MVTHKKLTGERAELDACQFLQSKGLTLVDQNYQCRLGEIDLIMRNKDMIIFVEVRARRDYHFSSAIETINFRKQQKIIRTATFFLQQRQWLNKVYCRFDVIGIRYGQDKMDIDWIPNAFSCGEF